MQILPPYCPSCHKAFFWTGPEQFKAYRTCSCKKGKKMVRQWMEDMRKLTEESTNPVDAITEPEPEGEPNGGNDEGRTSE